MAQVLKSPLDITPETTAAEIKAAVAVPSPSPEVAAPQPSEQPVSLPAGAADVAKKYQPQAEQIAPAERVRPHSLAPGLRAATKDLPKPGEHPAHTERDQAPESAKTAPVDIWSLNPEPAAPAKPDKTLAHGQSRGWWLERYRVGDQMGLKPHAQDALLRDSKLTSRNYDEGARLRELLKGCDSAESQNRAHLMHNVEVQRRAELFQKPGTVGHQQFREARQDAFRGLRDHDEKHGNRIGQNADISREMSPRQQLNNDVARSNGTWPDAEQRTEFNHAVERLRQHPEIAQRNESAVREDHRIRTADVGLRRSDIPADSTEVTLAPAPLAQRAPAPAEFDPLKIKV